MSRIWLYKPQVEEQKKILPKLVIIKGEEFEVKKILNKRTVREKEKFLVIFFFFFVQKFITWYSIAVHSRLSTTGSLHGPQGPDYPITGNRHYQYQKRNLT